MVNLTHTIIREILENNTKHHIEREEVRKKERDKHEGITNNVKYNI